MDIEETIRLRKELGFTEDNFVLIAKNTTKYYVELHKNYKDKIENETTLLLTAGILDAQTYIFVEHSIDVSEIEEAWESQYKRVEKEVHDVLENYEHDELVAKATKAFMKSPQFRSLRKQLGIKS